MGTIYHAGADHARYIDGRLPKAGPFQLLFDGQGALPAVCYQLADQSAPFTLYDLPDRLRARGWQVPAYPLPANRQDTTVQQILIRHGVQPGKGATHGQGHRARRRYLGSDFRAPQPAFHHT